MRPWLLATLALMGTIAFGPRVVRVLIGPGGMWDLTVTNPTQAGPAVLHTDTVHDWSLTADGVGGGQRITNVAPGVNPGDALVYGQSAASVDFTGNYPALMLTRPMFHQGVNVSGAIPAGTCAESAFGIPGVTIGMVATASAPFLADHATVAARVSGPGTVAIRVCAFTPQALFGEPVEIGVVQ